MNKLYASVGISKQAIHQYSKRQEIFDEKIQQLILEADELRSEHPGCGVEKMYYTLNPDFIGRDRFIELFMDLGYRVKRFKNYRRTTIASKLYYPNLIKGLKVYRPSTIWQSDITYIQVQGRFYYAVFIVDVFTKEIVGHQVSDHMRATANIKALKLAFKRYDPPEIHHSDRGCQYTYKEYTGLLVDKKCRVSMGLTAQDNAYAERINRTIKEEYLDYWKPSSYLELKKMVKKAVVNYNSKRLHNNLKREVPKSIRETDKYDKSLEITIFDNNN